MTAAVQNKMVKTTFECFIELDSSERVMHPEVAFLLLPFFCPPYGQHPWLLSTTWHVAFFAASALSSIFFLALSFKSLMGSLLSSSLGVSLFASRTSLASSPRSWARFLKTSPARLAMSRMRLRVLPPASGATSTEAAKPIPRPAQNEAMCSNLRKFVNSFVFLGPALNDVRALGATRA